MTEPGSPPYVASATYLLIGRLCLPVFKHSTRAVLSQQRPSKVNESGDETSRRSLLIKKCVAHATHGEPPGSVVAQLRTENRKLSNPKLRCSRAHLRNECTMTEPGSPPYVASATYLLIGRLCLPVFKHSTRAVLSQQRPSKVNESGDETSRRSLLIKKCVAHATHGGRRGLATAN